MDIFKGKKKRVIIILLLALVVFFGGVLYGVKRRFLDPALKEGIRKELSSLFNAELEIGPVHSILPDRFFVKGLRITKDRFQAGEFDLVIEKIWVIYNPLRLLRGDSHFLIDEIKLISPKVRLVRSKGGVWNFEGLLKSIHRRSHLPGFQIKRGEVVIYDEGLSSEVSLAAVEAELKKEGDFLLWCLIGDGTELSVAGEISDYLLPAFSFEGEFGSNAIDSVCEFFETVGVSLKGRWSGGFCGSVAQRLQKFDLRAKICDGEIVLTKKEEIKLDRVNADFTLSKGWRTKGWAFTIERLCGRWKGNEFTARCSCRDISMGKFTFEFSSKSFNPKSLFWDTEPEALKGFDIHGDLRFVGSGVLRDEGLFSGELNLDLLGKTGASLGLMKAALSYKEGTVCVESLKWGDWGEGRGRVHFSKSKSGVDFKLRVEDAGLGLFLQFAGGEDLVKRFQQLADVKVSGEVAVLSTKNVVSWKVSLVSKDTPTGSSFDKGRVFLGWDGKKGVLDLEAFKGNGYVWFKGDFDSLTDRAGFHVLGIKGEARDFKLGDSTLNTTFSMKGKVEGGVFKPKVNGRLDFTSLQVDRFSFGALSLALKYRDRVIRVSTLRSENGFSFGGDIVLKKPTRVDVRFGFERLRVEEALGIFGKEDWGLIGDCSGNIVVKGSFPDSFSISSKDIKVQMCRIFDAEFHSGRVSFFADSKKVFFKRLRLCQKGGGRLVVSGLFPFRSSLSTKFDLDISSLSFFGRTVSGRFFVSGPISSLHGTGWSCISGGRGEEILIKDIDLKVDFSDKSRLKISSMEAVLDGSDLFIKGGVYLNKDVLSLDYTIDDYPAGKISKVLGGRLRFKGRIAGSISRPNVSCKVFASPLIIKGEELGTLTGPVSFEDGVLVLEGIMVGSSLRISGKVDRRLNVPQVDLRLQFSGFDLSRIISCLGISGVSFKKGTILGNVEVEGTLDRPKVFGAVKIKEPFFAEEVEAEFLVEKDIVDIERLVVRKDGGVIRSEGLILNLGEKEVYMDLDFSKFRFLGPHSLSGRVVVSGTCDDMEAIQGRVSLTGVVVNDVQEIGDLTSKFGLEEKGVVYLTPLDSRNGIMGRVLFGDGRMNIVELCVVLDGFERLKIDGYIDFSDRSLRLDTYLDAELRFLEKGTILKDVSGRGTWSGMISGGFDSLKFDGVLKGESISFSLPPFEDAFRGCNFEVKIIDNSVEMGYFIAELGRSKVILKSQDVFSVETLNYSCDVTAPVKVLIPGLCNGWGTFKGELLGDIEFPKIKGEVIVSNADFTYPVRPEPGRDKLFFEEDDVDWDLRLCVDQGVRYYNDYVDITIKEGGWLRLKTKNRKLHVTGRLESERGEIEFLGNQFQVRRACLQITEPDMKLFLDGEAEREVEGTLILLSYRGYLFDSRPLLSTPYCYPPKSREEIISLLRFGRSYTDLPKTEVDAFLQRSIAKLVGLGIKRFVVDPVARRINTLLKLEIKMTFPVIEQKIGGFFADEDENGPEADATISRFSIGKYITDDLYLIYRGIVRSERRERDLLGLKHSFECLYKLPGGEVIRYKFMPEEEGRHEFRIEKEFRF